MFIGLGQIGCTKLTAEQIYQYALSAGFPPETAVTMTAIALKESGGNTCAHNAVPPDDSYGLYQINMLGNLGPSRRAQFGLAQNSDLYDPAINTAAAYALWGGNDNNLNIAWAINRGVDQTRYLAYLPTAQAAAQAIAGGASEGDSTPDSSTSEQRSFFTNVADGDPTSLALTAGAVLLGAWLVASAI